MKNIFTSSSSSSTTSETRLGMIMSSYYYIELNSEDTYCPGDLTSL